MSMSKNMDTIEKLEFISDAKRLIRKIESDCRCLELLLGGFMFEYDYGVLK